MIMNKRLIGSAGESAAAGALKKKGLHVLQRNFRRGPGEIDLIAQDGRTIVFVEVKQRTTVRYGQPAEAVNRTKQQRIVRTAMLYLAENNLDDVPVRFDIVEVLPDEIRHIPNAFDATDLF